LLIAGHETTATSLAWAFATILERGDVVAKIRHEIDAATGGATLEREHFGRMPYLDAVIKEAMRLRPITPATAGRVLKAPLLLRDYTIPAGVLCSACAPLLHRRPELYPEPDAFKPERFVGKKVDPYEWLPFGGGVRRCLGMAFALHEIKVVLATVLGETSLDLVASPASGRRGFFISPRDGTRVIVHERHAPHTN
jgi:cytochrome P450